jgi:sulfoxide reductase heme-binding subunit YedZ
LKEALMNTLRRIRPEWWIHLLATLNLAKMAGVWISGNADKLPHVSGETAFNFLLFSLLVTPMFTLTGKNFLPPLKKPLGLYAFFFSVVHLGTYALDLKWNLVKVWTESLEDPSLWMGWAALLLMVPLTVTSTRGWMKRLKRSWKRLHQVVYILAVVAVVHVLLLDDGLEKGAFYSGMLLLLLSVRIPPVRRFIVQHRPDWRPFWRRDASKPLIPAHHS